MGPLQFFSPSRAELHVCCARHPTAPSVRKAGTVPRTRQTSEGSDLQPSFLSAIVTKYVMYIGWYLLLPTQWTCTCAVHHQQSNEVPRYVPYCTVWEGLKGLVPEEVRLKVNMKATTLGLCIQYFSTSDQRWWPLSIVGRQISRWIPSRCWKHMVPTFMHT